MFALLSEGCSQSDIARHFGVTPQAISKIVAKAEREAAARTSVQPVAPADDIEIVRQPTPRPVQPDAQNQGPGSEWRGIGLAPTLGDRYRQLEMVQGPEAAREFGIREAWTLTRQGSSVEAISQQFDLAVEVIEGFIGEARRRAVARINEFDPRLSLAAALQDIEMARSAAMRTMLSAKASDAARALARDALVRIAGRETDLAATIAQFRAAQGLDDGDTGAADMDALSFWMPHLKKGPTR